MSKSTIYLHYCKYPNGTYHLHSWCFGKKMHKRFLKERCEKAFITKKVTDSSDIMDIVNNYSSSELTDFDYESSNGVYTLLATDKEDSEVTRCKEVIENFLGEVKELSIAYLEPKYANIVVQLCKCENKDYCTTLDLLKILTTMQHVPFYGTEAHGNVYDFLLPF